MPEENQQNTCEDIEITTSGADIIISVSDAESFTTDSFTAEITVSGENCQSAATCVWDGQKWVCS